MVKDVLIGIHVDESPEKLHAAVRQIETATREPYRLVVLDDGTGQNLLNGLTSRLQISSTPDRQGAAACFNRLISQRAELYVFLENGVLPGPDWLTLLIEALEADPANGLAGPSTNRAWNAQAAVRGRLPEPVTETARYLATRHGAGARTLEPRYSLSDFCYAVTAETVAAVGGRGYRLRHGSLLGDGLQYPSRARGVSRRLGDGRLCLPIAHLANSSSR